MADVHVTDGEGEGGASDAERAVERDLGAALNELDHLAETVAEHTTTLKGYEDDKRWITERFEALERDLATIPRVPGEITTEIASSIAELRNRIAALETEPEREPETKPPPAHEREDGREGGRDREHTEKRRSILDRVF